jgi:hypothetical protein
MTISSVLQERYTTEVDVDWRDALVLVHPAAESKFLINHTEEYVGFDINGASQLFLPVPMQITPPSRDDSGNSDMSITICGIEQEALNFLYDALDDATQSIRCWYSIFILGDPNPQIVPWLEFQLTGIAVGESSVTATASRSSVINKPFPNELYRLSRFPGLRRR